MLLLFFCCCCFTSSTSAKHFPLRTLFFQGNKKSHLGQDRLNTAGGVQGSFWFFWSKTAEHSVLCGQVNHPSGNEQMHLKNLQKNSPKPNAASHNNAIWYTGTDRFLEHRPSGGSLYYKWPTLQKTILGFWGGPLSYGPFVSGFFHIAQCLHVSSTLKHRSLLHSHSLLDNVPLYGCAASLSIIS